MPTLFLFEITGSHEQLENFIKEYLNLSIILTTALNALGSVLKVGKGFFSFQRSNQR